MLQIRLLGQFDVRIDGKRVAIPTRAAQSLFAFLALTAGTVHRREKLAGIFWPDTSDENARKSLRQELWRIRKAISTQGPAASDYLIADEFTLTFNREAEYWLDAAQMERPGLDLQSLTSNLSLYQGELLPGFYEDWILLERERIQTVFESKMEQLVEQLVEAERWTAVQEQSERWLAQGNTPEPAFRALMLSYSARGDMAKVSAIYQRCVDDLRDQFGVEPSAETHALYNGLLKGAKAPRRAKTAQPSGTVTFLFTDIQGSTRLLDKLGEQYAASLAEHHEILRAAIQKWRGQEVDTQGDAFFVTFPRALDAVQCAAEAQRTLADHKWPLDEPIRVRMGLHTGEPLIATTGYVGMDVHRAARIGDAGHGGQVLLSQATRELIIHDLPEGMLIRDLGEHRFKDMKYPTPIFQLVIEGLPIEFPPLKTKFSGTEAPTPGEAPFKGLQYFEEADSELFFGRELLTAKLVNRLRGLPSPEGEGHSERGVRFLSVIIGASGSGKSSLVRAGLIPALKKGEVLLDGTKQPKDSADWQVHIITPTAHPLEALATELTRDSESITAVATLMDDLTKEPRSLSLFLGRRDQTGHTLLVIDQFEELFTLCRDEFEREAFIDNLLSALSPADSRITLVMTLRADFYAHLAQYPELRQAVAQQQEYIGPMTTEELRHAIEEPARRGHWEFEPGLVDLILRDVGDEPGALPLLSHALLETWKRRAGHTLTLKGYADAGGVHGAIAHTAESMYQNLSPEEQTIARNIFLRLTELGEGTEDTRRRASFEELMSASEDRAEVRAVLNMLADARLVTLGEDTAEVAHEALIREWPTLREWLNQDREGLRLHRHLTEAAHDWALLERDPGALYRGVHLAQAREWAALHPNALNAAERYFLEASTALEQSEAAEREAQRDRELAAAQELAETQRQSASRLWIRNRVITTVGSIAVILALLAGLFGVQSNQNAIAAETNARTAFGRELAASADNNINVDPELSILLGLQGVEATRLDGFVLPEVENALHRAIGASRIEKTLDAHKGSAWAVAYSPDGTLLATGGQDKTVRIWNTTTYENIMSIDAHDADVDSISFSPDSKRIATSSDDGTAKIWDATTRKLLLTLRGHKNWILTIAFRPDGKQLATISLDNTIKLWDATTGSELTTWDLQEVGPHLTYSQDGTQILFWADFQLHIRDTNSGEEIYSIPSPEYNFALTPDSTRLAIISEEGTFISVLNTSDNQLIYNIKYPSNQIEHMSFSPDGTLLAAAGRDRKVHIWDASTGTEIFTLAGHTEFIFRLAFSPDGKHLASAGFDGIVKVWSLEASHEVLTIPTMPFFSRFALSPDGTKIAVNGVFDPITGRNSLLMVWDAENGEHIFQQEADENKGMAVAFSPDGREIATGGFDQILKTWNAASGELILSLPVDDESIIGIEYHPDGKIFATAGTSGKIQLFDRATGRALQSWDAGLGQLSNVTFSPDGSRLAVLSPETNEAKVFDADTGKELLTLKGHTNSNWGLDFNSDGTRLVTAGRDGTARIWDAGTGKLLLTFKGHTSTIGAVHFSPDDARIVTSSADSTVRIWDAFTARQLLEVAGYVASVEFTPDGKRLVIPRDRGNGIQIIALSIEELVQIAKSRLTRTWTLDECQKYLHMETCPSDP
jgi:WD40 repeat protein/class 3 adenylate cyclase